MVCHICRSFSLRVRAFLTPKHNRCSLCRGVARNLLSLRGKERFWQLLGTISRSRGTASRSQRHTLIAIMCYNTNHHKFILFTVRLYSENKIPAMRGGGMRPCSHRLATPLGVHKSRSTVRRLTWTWRSVWSVLCVVTVVRCRRCERRRLDWHSSSVESNVMTSTAIISTPSMTSVIRHTRSDYFTATLHRTVPPVKPLPSFLTFLG